MKPEDKIELILVPLIAGWVQLMIKADIVRIELGLMDSAAMRCLADKFRAFAAELDRRADPAVATSAAEAAMRCVGNGGRDD